MQDEKHYALKCYDESRERNLELDKELNGLLNEISILKQKNKDAAKHIELLQRDKALLIKKGDELEGILA